MMKLLVAITAALALAGRAAAWLPSGGIARPACRAASSKVVGIQMKKKLKENTERQVVLVQDISSLGQKGEIVTVKKAYFRNYLGPYGMAEAATPEVLAKAEEERQKREAELAAQLEGARQQAATIDAVCGSTAITIMQRAGPDGKLFGSVTSAEISQLVEERAGVTVDKKNIDVPQISEAGSYVVGLKLHPKVDVTVNIVVVAQQD
mmetsp:Transcript_20027/g.51617  ORF Transcript_20027/g.51617 Transcript_20027/m.51617 type:complete len:207 (-) Transcript_20027:203-823(-)